MVHRRLLRRVSNSPPFLSATTYFSSVTVGIRDAQGFVVCVREHNREFPILFLDAASASLIFVYFISGFRKTLVTIVLLGK
jgi:hypothetical protein